MDENGVKMDEVEVDEDVLEELISNLMDKILADFPLLINIVQKFLNSCSLQESPNVILYELPGFAMNTLGVMEKNTVVRLAIQVLAFLSFDEFSFRFFFFFSCGKRSVRMVLKTKIQILAGAEPPIFWSSIFDNMPLFSGT